MSSNTCSQRYEMMEAGLDLLDQGISIFDENLRLVAWNRAFLSILDFPTELAYEGATFESFIRFNAERLEYGEGDLAQQIEERVAAARLFRTHTTERTRPNGKILYIQGEPLPHKGFITVYTDITEQRYLQDLSEHQNLQLEERVRRHLAQLGNANADLKRIGEENLRYAEALKRSEQQLRLINDNVPILIGYVDRYLRYQYANKGYSDWYCVPENSVTGRSVPDLIGEHVWHQVKEHVMQALAGMQVTYEYQILRKGKQMHARSTLVPDITSDGDTKGIFVFSHDITEPEHMQTALIQAQKMDAIGQLTGGLAHDFNNLLTVVIGNLSSLQECTVSDEKISEYLVPALQSARRGVKLIKRLMAFSRKQPLEPQPVDVADLVGGLANLVRHTLPRSIDISTDLSSASIKIMVDPAQLESALLNFSLNARDAMPEGGILHIAARLLDLTTDAEKFEVPTGRYVIIEVTDNGCGMSRETMDRIFEPLFTTKRIGLGTGLGMTMAHAFARQSGGGIQVQSKLGIGTTVMLAVPYVPVESTVTMEDCSIGPIESGTLVLLVEDESDVRKVIRTMLTDLGYLVLEAENGTQALEMIRSVADIRIVLSDIVMPGGVSGHQLAEMIKSQQVPCDVVLMSGYNNVQDNTLASDLPILHKPFSRHELANAFKSLGQSQHDNQ